MEEVKSSLELVDELQKRLPIDKLAELLVKHGENPSPANAKPYLYLIVELYQGKEVTRDIKSQFALEKEIWETNDSELDSESNLSESEAAPHGV